MREKLEENSDMIRQGLSHLKKEYTNLIEKKLGAGSIEQPNFAQMIQKEMGLHLQTKL